MDAVTVADNQDESRFEIRQEDLLCYLSYRHRGDRLVLIHAEVPRALEGRGIAGQLTRAAVDRAEREGLTIVPLCPFTRSWLERHPEQAARVTVDTGAGS